MEDKDPWGPGTPWKNSSAFFVYVRGCIRRAWSRHPVKITLINSIRKRIPNPNPKGKTPTVWGCTCAVCLKDFPQKDIEIDHIVPAGSLNCREDIQGFVERLLFVTEDDLRAVCKECHRSISHSEKQGISFEQAQAQRVAIALQKEKKDVAWLKEQGYDVTDSSLSNAKKRREKIVEHLLKKVDNGRVNKSAK